MFTARVDRMNCLYETFKLVDIFSVSVATLQNTVIPGPIQINTSITFTKYTSQSKFATFSSAIRAHLFRALFLLGVQTQIEFKS